MLDAQGYASHVAGHPHGGGAAAFPAREAPPPALECTTPTKPRWDFDLERPARVDTQFQDPWTDSIQKYWSALSTGLGTILVATQIMLNLRQRKKTQAA